MGSYAFLEFGDFVVSSFRESIRLEAILLFKRDDLTVQEYRLRGGEIYKRFMFLTTAGEAKERFSERGIDLDFCSQLFESFQTGKLLRHERSQDGSYTSAEASFDQYMQALHHSFYELGIAERNELVSGIAMAIGKEPEEVLRVFYESRTWDVEVEGRMLRGLDSYHPDAFFFGDAMYVVLLRCLLEVVPPNTIVNLDFSELVERHFINEDEVPGMFDYLLEILFRRIELDYRIYGFVIESDPAVDARLRERISALDEDQFIEHVLQPLLQRMGYERVRRVSFHGSQEFGSDILPFRYKTPLGTLEYYAVQAKAVPIHGTSARRGNAAELISQATQAFAVAFVDDIDNERKRIDKFVVATNKEIAPSARTVIEQAIEGARKLIFLDIDGVLELSKKYRLTQYILFSDLQ